MLLPLWLFANHAVTSDVEADLAARAKAALPADMLDKAQVSVAGRDVTITGTPFSAADRDAVEAAIVNVPGVRLLNSDMTDLAQAKPYHFEAAIMDQKITLSGDVPDAITRAKLLAEAKLANPGASIVDQMTYAGGAPAGFAAAGAFTIGELAKLKEGKADINDSALSLDGSAQKSEIAAQIKAATAATMPGGLILKAANIKDLEAPVQAAEAAAAKAAADEKAAADKAAEEKAAADKAAMEKAAADKAAEEKAVADKAAADKAAEEKAAMEKAAADKAAAEKALADKAAADQAAMEKAAADKAALEKAAMEKAAAAKAAAPAMPAAPAAVVDACNTQIGQMLQSDKIHFAVARADILPNSFDLLHKIGDELKRCADAKVTVTGFTDADGDPKLNQVLSESRANAVVTYLAKDGVDESHLQARGMGASDPVAPNDTRTNKAKNRRIEFSISN
ncbi:MAG: OmpA family protein [Hyphomicrobiales bacterium]|nr:OmpA family protein [Hyphomicrobiales bacterium]MDE2114043.1 OmpA family protein [Hyphomicrobiales bacterium]